MAKNWILMRSAMTFICDLETWLKIAAQPLPQSSVYVKYEPDRAKSRVNMLCKWVFCTVWYDLDPWPINVIQGHYTPYDQRYNVSEVWDKDLADNSAITIKLRLRN